MAVIAGVVAVAVMHARGKGMADRRERGVVTRLFTEKRQHTRRIRRRVYVRSGHPYTLFQTELRCDDGRQRTVKVDYTRYRRLHPCDTALLLLRPDYLGFYRVCANSTRWRKARRTGRAR